MLDERGNLLSFKTRLCAEANRGGIEGSPGGPLNGATHGDVAV